MKKRNPRVTNIVAVCCTLVFMLILWQQSHNTGSTLLIKVDSVVPQSSVLKLMAIVQDQKRIIDRYKHEANVIFSCPGDESIKYPKYASDDYTTVTMGTNDECGNTSELDAVMIVHSAVENFENRERFRKLYAHRNVTKPYKLKVVFLIGRVLDAELQIQVEIENMQYGDTVQGTFLDSYHNLTLKATMGYRWVSETCRKGYKLLIKMDDDVVLDVHRFLGDFYSSVDPSNKTKMIFCQEWKNARVRRIGKWKLDKERYVNETFGFPYCSGFLVAVTPDIVKVMYETAKSIDFLWIDDVFMYGLVPQVLRYVTFTNIGGRSGIITAYFWRYKGCVEKANTEKKDCHFVAVVVSNSSEFFEVRNNFPSYKKQELNITAENKPESLSSQQAHEIENELLQTKYDVSLTNDARHKLESKSTNNKTKTTKTER